MRRKTAAAFVLVFAVLTISVSAQTTIYVYSPTFLDEYSAPYVQPVLRAMEDGLAARGFQLGARSEARIELRPEMRVSPPRAYIALNAYDAHSGVLIGNATVRARSNVTIFASVEELIEQLNQPLLEFQAMIASGSGYLLWPVPLATSVEVPDPQHTQVRYAANGNPITGDARLAVGVRLDVRYEREGHYSELASVRVEGDEVRFEPPHLERKRTEGLQFHASAGPGVGVGIGWRLYPVADRLHVAFESTSAASGVFGDSQGVVVHQDLRAIAGFNLFNPRSSVRFVASTGAGLTATLLVGALAPAYTDWYWNVANLSLEYRTGSVLWFGRFGANYFLGSERSAILEGVAQTVAVGVVKLW